MPRSSVALVGLLALTLRFPRLHPRQIRPGKLLRGCIALICLLIATSLALIALVLVQP